MLKTCVGRHTSCSPHICWTCLEILDAAICGNRCPGASYKLAPCEGLKRLAPMLKRDVHEIILVYMGYCF